MPLNYFIKVACWKMNKKIKSKISTVVKFKLQKFGRHEVAMQISAGENPQKLFIHVCSVFSNVPIFFYTFLRNKFEIFIISKYIAMETFLMNWRSSDFMLQIKNCWCLEKEFPGILNRITIMVNWLKNIFSWNSQKISVEKVKLGACQVLTFDF